MPTKEQLARWRSLGFAFDGFYDTIAKESVSELGISFQGSKFEKDFYVVRLGITVKHFKSKNLILTIRSVDPVIDPKITVPFEMSKNVEFNGESHLFDFKIPVNLFDNYDGQNFRATVYCEDKAAETEVFKLKQLVKSNLKNDNLKSIKDLEPSSRVYLFLKQSEGLGYNVIKNEMGEIIKVLPYDDGGEMGIGNATIGWGHLIDTIPFDETNPRHKKWKDGITVEEAERLLFDDVKIKSDLLKKQNIKVELLQNEFDSLVISIFNGAYSGTLEKAVNNKANLKKEDIFKAFLVKRFAGKKEIDGLLKRRALEAEIFINDNWMPFPSKKFKNDREYINYVRHFLKTGLLTLFLVFSASDCSCQDTTSKAIKKQKEAEIEAPHFKEYQENELLNDKNDNKLNSIDTILNFSDNKMLYELKVQNEKVRIKAYRWKEIPEGKIAFERAGIHKNGYVYLKNKKGEYELEYKIILNKGLFYWNDYSHWELINSGDY